MSDIEVACVTAVFAVVEEVPRRVAVDLDCVSYRRERVEDLPLEDVLCRGGEAGPSSLL